MRKNQKKRIILLMVLIGLMNIALYSNTCIFNHKIINKRDLLLLNQNTIEYTNFTVISDGIGGVYWNPSHCRDPSITIDNTGKLHAIWNSMVYEPSGSDNEILYASSTDGVSWSNFTVISDDYTYWNNGYKYDADIAIDSNNKIHVVWKDSVNGPWGTDDEIMYISSEDGITWSNVTVISDDPTLWNNGSSSSPKIAIDKTDKIHVIWSDETDGAWGDDSEIMYTSSTDGILWSNAIVISDDYTLWNNGTSYHPDIAIDNNNKLHVIWTDRSIFRNQYFLNMYTSSEDGITWTNATIMSEYNLFPRSVTNYPVIAADNYGTIHVVASQPSDYIYFGSDLNYLSYSDDSGWSEPIVLTDDTYYRGSTYSLLWTPSIAVDSFGTVHISYLDLSFNVYSQYDNVDIRYQAYNKETGKQNSRIISNGYGGLWVGDNEYECLNPSITVDPEGNAYTLWLSDMKGPWRQYAEDEVFYCQISNIPNLDSPEDITYEEDMIKNNITWNPFGINPNNYTISNGTHIIQTGNWNSSSPINLNIDGLSHGSYSFTINITNMQGKYSTDTVIVNVLAPLSPDISEPSDMIFEEDENDHSILWTATDLYANNYTISNGTNIIKIGNWISGISIELELGAIKEGIYNYDIIVYDKGGHSSSDSVSVNVTHPFDPTISQPDNINYTQYTKGNIISWIASDLFPDYYRITRNGSNIESHSWISDVPIIINIDNLPDRLFLYQIFVYDRAGHSATDSVYVLVIASNKPNTISLGFFPIGITLVGIIAIIAYLKRKIKI